MKSLFSLILFCVVTLITNSLKSQYNFQANDSLKGFDEQAFIKHNTAHGMIGAQLKLELQIAKKEFIFSKYYKSNGSGYFPKTTATTIVQPSCTNMDFESGTFFGWIGSTGTSTNSITMGGCCPTPGAVNSAVIASAGFDPAVGAALPLISPFGGTKIARVNNVATGAKVDRIEQSFNVTSSNAILQIAFAAVLNSSGAHNCNEQPYVNISLIDSAGNTLACPYLAFSAPSTACTTTAVGWIAFGAGHYKPWSIQTLDLSPYIGSFVTIQFTVGDCTQTGHYGYAYFDCQCLPLEISLNGTIFDATPMTPINISTCGFSSALIIAPTGLGPYLWEGPLGSGISSVPTQSILTATPGTYTLTMSPIGSCYGPTIKYIVLNVTPTPTVTNITAQATCTNATGSGTLNVVSGIAPYTYSWLPPASTGSVGTGLTPGTDYSITVTDLYGCKNTTTISIASFTNAPTYTVSPLTANLSCLTNTILVSALTGTNTTAVWTNTTTSSFIASTAGTYSVILTNTLSLCTTTVPVTISSNTIGPVATFTAVCNTGTINLNASSTAGIALGWLSPTLPFPSPVSNPGSSTATGVFTLTATNLITGCKTTYTLQSLVPDLTVAVTPQMSITCTASTLQATATSSLAGVNFTWDNGVTTSTVNPYSITSGGTYTTTVSFPGGCSTESVITITTNTLVDVSISSSSTVVPCSTNSLTLNANSTVGGPYTYAWSLPSGTGSSYNVSNAGTYTVIATNSINGCTATATQSVSHETITASFTADVYQGLMPLVVTFSNTSFNPSGPVAYTWSLGNTSTTYTTTSPSTVYNSQGTYMVILTATKGFCVDTAVRFIKVDLVSFLSVPNVFTPNGDGKNEIFILDCTNMGEINMIILDRWGLKMFESTDIGKMSWDGKNKGGSIVTDGTYFYIITAKGLDDKTYNLQNTINVFR
jgi:gliding motility-associated-like protein